MSLAHDWRGVSGDPGPTRRRLLAATAATAGLAGCLDVFGGGDGDTGPTTDTTTEATTTRETTTTTTTTEPEPATRADAMFRGGLRRLGYHPERSVPDEAAEQWAVDGINKGDHTAAKASAVPAPTGDLIVPGDDGTVYAVGPAGEVRWAAATHPSAFGIHGTPAIANGTAYVGAYDGALYAFDLATGERRWRTPLGDAIGSSPAYHDGRLYVGVEYLGPNDGSLYAVDADGTVIEERTEPTDHPHSTPAIDLDAGYVVMGANDGVLYGWEYPSLEPAWEFDTGEAIKGPVAVHDGAAVFGSWDDAVFRVDVASGDPEWAYPVGEDVMSGPAIDTDSGTVYVGSHDTGLHAVSLASGERRFRFDTGGWITGCPTVTRDHVVVGSYDGNCYAVEKDGGDPTWAVSFDGWITCEPLVLDESVYVTERATDTTAGGLYRIGPA